MKKKLSRAGAILACAGIVFTAPSICTKGMAFIGGVPFRIGASFAFIVLCILLWFKEARESNPGKVASKPNSRGNFDWGMHYFRAFAILAILACHYCAWHGYKHLNQVLFSSSTIFFLFISGYLCQYLDFKRRVEPVKYYVKKLENVICPFIIFSIIFAIMKGNFRMNIDFVKFMLLGRVQGQYWYIPFVSVLFLFSPLLCRLSDFALMVVCGLWAVLWALYPLRPGSFTIQWPGIFHFYSAFTVFYLLGFVYCRKKEIIDRCLVRLAPLLIITTLLLTVLLFNPAIFGLRSPSLSIDTSIQRTLVIGLVILFLSKFKDKRILVLDIIAKYSFTLYFIHFAFYIQCAFIRNTLLRHMSIMPMPISEILIYVLYTAIMLMLAILFKTAFGKYSRPFLGS